MVMMMIMGKRFFHLLQVFFVLLLCKKPATGFNSAVGDANIECIEKEREALLTFKQGLVDSYGRLSSWGNEDGKKDCCKWRGIKCSNQTGHVIMLDLQFDMSSFFSSRASMPFFDASGPPLRGKISPSLLELQHLSYLDLSFNDFERSPIPMFIGYLTNLRYLNFSGANFAGTIPSHLGNLSNLQYLDLGWNTDISPSDNPISLIDVENLEWLSHLSSLRHLDLSGVNLAKSIDWLQAINTLPSLSELHLSSCQLSGVVPPSLSFINSSTSLAILDLSSNYLSPSIYHWLFNFSGSLVLVDLSGNLLQGSIPDAFQNMKSLEHLFLASTQLEGRIPRSFAKICTLRTFALPSNNFTQELPEFVQNLSGCIENSLEILALTENRLRGSLPDMTRFSSLRELYLGYNQLTGILNQKLGELSTLVVLDLTANRIGGSLPDLTNMSSLRGLYVNGNQLNGTITETLGQLPKLQVLAVSSNSLEGTVSEAHLSTLPGLKLLNLAFNSLSLDLSPHWVPPFQLDSIFLGACKLGPSFPKWLQTQKNLSTLDISSNGISESIPKWFWDLSPGLVYLNLSNNHIGGMLPNLSANFFGFPGLDLSSNHFDGPLPLFPSTLTSLKLSNNMFSGSISSLCAITGGTLTHIDLSDNLLFGGLPNCWMNFPGLVILNLEKNNFSGKIPSSIGSLSKIQTMHLRRNSFSGELPSSLKNCTLLRTLDLGENKFSGKIPRWMGERLSGLIVLRLRSNEFYGSIPRNLCHLTFMQILDLSQNNITGAIPKCLNNFTALAGKGTLNITTIAYPYVVAYAYRDKRAGPNGFGGNYVDSAVVGWKGREFEYGITLGLVKGIDLSSNGLTGDIPQEITNLLDLIALNLSRNNLSGLIPMNIGQLNQLESLDLSRNQFKGPIPESISDLSFLSHLDLSYNDLSGKIPSSTQLQSFEASAYVGNLGLCGPPLAQNCSTDEASEGPQTTGGSPDIEDDKNEFEKWFYMGMGLGFIVGFWGVCGGLLLKRSCRHAYFLFLDNLKDWLYVTTAVQMARLRRKFQSEK